MPETTTEILGVEVDQHEYEPFEVHVVRLNENTVPTIGMSFSNLYERQPGWYEMTPSEAVAIAESLLRAVGDRVRLRHQIALDYEPSPFEVVS